MFSNYKNVKYSLIFNNKAVENVIQSHVVDGKNNNSNYLSELWFQANYPALDS